MDKIYDDTTTATISGTASLDNKIASDDVSIQAGNAAFDSADAGENRTVTFTGYYLIGEAAGNYNLVSQPDPVTAKIEKRPVKITANEQTVPVGDAIAEMEVSTETGTDKGILKDRGHMLAEVTLTPYPDPRSSDHLTDIGTIAATGAVIKKDNTDVTANYVITYQDGHLNITKGYQTITAENVTVTYGDTDKKVVASVTRPATGGGSISYAVKDGSADYIEVNASTGALTIKKAPVDGKAYVVVTASGTAIYEQATKEVTVTINKANAVPATVSANNRTYDGTQKPLVTVDNSTLMGGTMYYALGENADTAPDFDGTSQSESKKWTTSIPAETNAGTYYVWYKAIGDENHNSTDEKCQEVTIDPAPITDVSVTLSATNLDYSSFKQTVTVTEVKLGDTVLTAGTDYEVTGETAGTNKGTYTVTVTGKGNYKDSAAATWGIDLVIPTINTAPTASAITYGQKLMGSTLSGGTAKNGNVDVEGTFAWKNAATAPAVSDSETTEYDVVFNPTDTENYGAAECKVKLAVYKADSVPAAVTANNRTYDGTEQPLVTVDDTMLDGGEMRYAFGTATEATQAYTNSIPAKTEAGTYYVWYKVVGDDAHADFEAKCITVTISEALKIKFSVFHSQMASFLCYEAILMPGPVTSQNKKGG